MFSLYRSINSVYSKLLRVWIWGNPNYCRETLLLILWFSLLYGKSVFHLVTIHRVWNFQLGILCMCKNIESSTLPYRALARRGNVTRHVAPFHVDDVMTWRCGQVQYTVHTGITKHKISSYTKKKYFCKPRTLATWFVRRSYYNKFYDINIQHFIISVLIYNTDRL